MKFLRIYVCTLLLVVVTISFYSCSKDDNQKAWGLTKVYMPQAAMLNGGLNHDYPVPLNNNASTNNYSIDSTSNTLKIVLGVYRSGLQKLEAFSVKIGVYQNATDSAVAVTNKGVALPTDVYTLPTEANIKDGQRESIFYLNVDLNKLLAKYPQYALKKMILVVGISQPTKYTLNESLSKTVVIIDGSSFMPAPKIVNGGDFEPGSEKYWTFLNTSSTVLPDSYASITGGTLLFDFGTSPVNGGKCCYNTIELQNGANYKFSCDITTSNGGNITSCRFFVAVSPVKPVEGVWYKYDTGSAFYTMLDAWNGLTHSVSGTLPQMGGWQAGIDKSTGIFTSNFSGTGYVVIGIAAWNSTIGKIVIDNVRIEAQ